MSELVFFTGTMDCGKSTLALQMDHNRSARGRRGVVFTRDDRAGEGVLSSRLGLSTAAVEVRPGIDVFT
jgi:thymidine kinase